MEWFPGGPPDRGALDAVAGDRPAYLVNRDWHGAWVSSAALGRAGIDARTPDPPDGRIERDADGTPQGTLHEGAASLVGALVPEPSLEQRVAGLLLAQRHLHARGITAWQDAIIGDYLGALDPLPAYLAAAAAASSPRGSAAPCGGTAAAAPGSCPTCPRGPGAQRPGRAARFLAGTVKIMQDGVAENQTAAMIDPYLNPVHCQPTGSGRPPRPVPRRPATSCARMSPRWTPRASRSICTPSATGPCGRRWTRSRRRGPATASGTNAHRHHIAHLQVVQPDDVPQVRRARRHRQHAGPVGRARAADGRADRPVHRARSGRPGSTCSASCARRRPAGGRQRLGREQREPAEGHPRRGQPRAPGATGADAEPFLPAQRLDLAEALAAYTLGSAYVNHLDSERGASRPGLLADLAVLAADPFAGPADEDWENISVEQTYVSGERVFPAWVSTNKKPKRTG